MNRHAGERNSAAALSRLSGEAALPQVPAGGAGGRWQSRKTLIHP
jgi:hypothetical protein